MPKKITSITLNNFRAYYGAYDRIDLPNGENVIIYGENGSGKSSLYKALQSYFQSSITPIPFLLNRYTTSVDGKIQIQFSDYDLASDAIIPGSEIEHYFGRNSADHNVPFIQTAALINGFLDYTDLLNVYFHKDPNPNLFNLIVLSLLGNHVPVSSGGAYRIKPRWNELQNQLINQSTRRTYRVHKGALLQLPRFQAQLQETLDDVFEELNRLLTTYFEDLRIQLSYSLSPLQFNYGSKWEWHTTADLRLIVEKDGVVIAGDYNDFLNEARLSAIAICLYLASLLVNPTGVDFKILYLDDVFIGLDAGNRVPILSILRNEFSDYQKFISTYDRHWFELAKKQFEIYNESEWSALEIYVGSEDVGGITINKPILVKGESHLSKATKYLHHRSTPDYPAAANYFRKALEELIQEFVPGYELVDGDFSRFADYKLTTVLHRAKKFLDKTGKDSLHVRKIIGLLHNLLHPLSHHEITSPIYKSELVIIEKAYYDLKMQLATLDIPNNYRCILETGKPLKIRFQDTPGNFLGFYELVLKEPLLLYKDGIGNICISNSACVTDSLYRWDNGQAKDKYHPKRDDSNFNYLSLEDACNRIHIFLTTSTGLAFAPPADYLSQIEYLDINASWVPLNTLIVTW